MVDPRGGFEPPYTDSESAVLPLDDRGIVQRPGRVPERDAFLKRHEPPAGHRGRLAPEGTRLLAGGSHPS